MGGITRPINLPSSRIMVSESRYLLTKAGLFNLTRSPLPPPHLCSFQNHCMATSTASSRFYSTSHNRSLHLDDFASLMTISSSFDSLFKVLFTFPSQYFFAIGLLSIFSFRGGLTPPWFRLQSQTARLEMTASLIGSTMCQVNAAFTLFGYPFLGLFPRHIADVGKRPSKTTSRTPFHVIRFQVWAFPSSLAVTSGITVVFFSSA